MARVHAVTDGTPETVEHDLSVMPYRVRHSLVRQLAEGERIVIRTRQSPLVLARDALWPVLTGWLWWWLVVDVKAAPRLIDLVFLGFLVALGRLGWKELERQYTWFVATNKRILKHEGIFTRKVPMMRLTKVTDMTYHRSLGGEIWNYGTIVIESAGQKQAIRELVYIPDPDEVNAALNSEIFGERPRTKPPRTGRSWPLLSRRQRRGDDGEDDGPRGGGSGGGPQPSDPGTGGVDISPAGHPPPPRTQPETWYRSSNRGGPARLGDTGEIPVVRAEDVEAWQAQRSAADTPHTQDADPFRRWSEPAAEHDWAADGGDEVREIPLYPPRDWVDRTR
ncbi:PH domain-containing protein [Phycicoccus sp. CSK15P-2]|uniref:PH domain-containing protein n=1 Tax=Phycicoccus sp. CSK15P-2 TaxID=2807627 RepID=UPI00194F0557|nr:PH domain-containing protein [Phycicoccus sp. CSK15P-2]MBM6404498.1 PH domain-containing protein [Phycicoccus sp. CSK15P-2]